MSSLRYPGGKTRACKILEKYVLTDMTSICSPFIGGGSFEYHMNKKKYTIHGYDIFSPLVNYWKHLIEHPVELSQEIEKYHPVTKKTFLEYRKFIVDNIKCDSIKLAALYFVLNRSSFSGVTLSGGFSSAAGSKRFTKSSISRVKNTEMKNIDVGLLSFEESIAKHPDSFIYADPPYYTARKLYGLGGEQQLIDHDLLFNVLSNRDDWIVSYDNCPYIRELYAKYEIIDLKWAYGMNGSKVSSEILIISPSVSRRLHDSK